MANGATISIDADTGRLWLDSGAVFLGEITALTLAGVTLAEGHSARITLFDEDRKTPLADNHENAAALDMRGERLRRIMDLAQGAKRSFYTTAIDVDGSGNPSADVLATGMVTVTWTPLVFELSDNAVASLKGPKGDTGAAAGFGTISATAATGEPGSQASATISQSGPNTAKNIAIGFTIPQGATGAAGAAAGFGTPTASATRLGEHDSPTASVAASGPDTAKAFAFTFGIPAGVMPKPSVGTVAEVAPDGTAKVEMRGQGTENPILDFWLKRGKSAYECAVARGYVGTEDDWLRSLVGGSALDMERSIATLSDAVATLARMVFGHETEIDAKLREIEIVDNGLGEKTLQVRNNY